MVLYNPTPSFARWVPEYTQYIVQCVEVKHTHIATQHLDYTHWYDRQKQTLKEVQNVQYVASMNPTAGSFTINTRLQRHFSVFAISFPQVYTHTHELSNMVQITLQFPVLHTDTY